MTDDDDELQFSENIEESPSIEAPLKKDDELVVDEMSSEDSSADTLTSSQDDQDDQSMVMDSVNDKNTEIISNDEIEYPDDLIDFRGESEEHIADLLRQDENIIGASALDNATKTVGSWENLLFRAILEPSDEEFRLREFLGSLSDEDRAHLSKAYKDENGKNILKTVSLTRRLSDFKDKTLEGDAALKFFAQRNKGGCYRIPLYNSGITIDVLVPTGHDLQTLLVNCIQADRQLGTMQGAHYFAYNDLMYKTHIFNFLQNLIIDSSYSDWSKRGKLWQILKINDLPAIIATIAAICYREGFEGFVTKCMRPKTDDQPDLCRHVETHTVNIFDLIVTRFNVLNKDAIDHLSKAHRSNAKHNAAQISKYQSGLGIEGEKISFDDINFVMRIPTFSEYIDAGQEFLTDIINEIEADNSNSRYDQLGLRYIRTFLPWIAAIEITNEDNVLVRTSDPRTILMELDRADDKDNDGNFKKNLQSFIDKSQLTYIGYPIVPCPKCGYTGDTPSGMWTFDPFMAFFTIAFRYTTQKLQPALKA